MTHIRSWSHSRAGVFESCPKHAEIKFIKRIPEPDRPLPPGKTEHANDRGTRVHEGNEFFVQGTAPAIPRESKTFQVELEAMRELYKLGMVSIEGEWGFNEAWEPCDYKTAWLRMKLDAAVFLTPFEAVAIDYKTGRMVGNEFKHGEQTQLYALGMFLRYPDLELVHTELWYLDQDELTRKTYTRTQALRFKDPWTRRGTAITTATTFKPNPNKFSCRYCPYGAPQNGFENGTGHCLAGKKL